MNDDLLRKVKTYGRIGFVKHARKKRRRKHRIRMHREYYACKRCGMIRGIIRHRGYRKQSGHYKLMFCCRCNAKRLHQKVE